MSSHAVSIRVREATRSDATVLLELIDALADYEGLARPAAPARDRLITDGFGEDRRFRSYLAELDGRPVGYAITLFTYSSFLALPTLYLEDLFVVPEARGHGVGRKILEHLAGEALRHGCGRMEWVVLDWNQGAIDFYEHLGARRLGEWLGYRMTGDDLRRLAGAGPE